MQPEFFHLINKTENEGADTLCVVVTAKVTKFWSFSPFFIGLIFSVSFILAFEHKEQCYSWEQYKLTTRWRTHAWNGSILYLWILLNRAKLKHKTWVNHFGLEVGKTCKFPTSSHHHHHPKLSQTTNVECEPPSSVHPFLSSMATNEVLMTTYFHRFGLIQSFWQCFCKSPQPNSCFTNVHEVNQSWIFSGAHTEKLISPIEKS